jgi:rhodanese-related sulfurtransferase
MPHALKLKRAPRRENACMVPRRLNDGLVQVDSTWGTVQPIQLAPGIRTIGELELIRQLEQDGALIDTRQPHFHRDATIPGARGIAHDQILGHLDQLDPSAPTVFFCNGPQCVATPDAIRTLLEAGYPGEVIVYYRGGMHDWITLGYPTVPMSQP